MDYGAGGVPGTLGEDLALLSVLPHDGRIANPQQLAFALMGSDLVGLATAGRIAIERGRIVVADPARTGDAELDAALRSLARPGQPLRAKDWISHPRKGLCDACLTRLAAAGAVRRERRPLPVLNRTARWRIADKDRLASARARLDAVARSEGPVTTAQAAFAGLAHAAGLGTRFYPGWDSWQPRQRLEQIARNKVPVTGPGPAAATATTAASEAAWRVAWAAQQVAVHASNQAVRVVWSDDTATAAAHHGTGYGGEHAGGGHAGGGHGP